MKYLLLVGVALALFVPTTASASYIITQRAAQHNAVDTVKYLYGADTIYMVTNVSATCYAQTKPKNWRLYNWHRWVCNWTALQDGEKVVFGTLRITGHSDDNYGYLVLSGARYV